MLTLEQHLDNLTRHIDLVREAGLMLGKRLISNGETDLGRLLIAKVYVHDASKFYGIQWDYMHAGSDAPKEKLELAVREHQQTNEHHAEFWGGVAKMPELAVCEMVVDWYARSHEFGTDLRNWIENTAIPRWGIDKNGQQYKWIMRFVNMLLEDSFVTEVEDKCSYQNMRAVMAD